MHHPHVSATVRSRELAGNSRLAFASAPIRPGGANATQAGTLPVLLPDPALPPWVSASVAYMLQHVNQPLRIGTLMNLAGLSASQFFTLFKRALGCTPLEFFIQVKMSRARELLSGTNLTIKEIACVLGYDDQFYFSRRFKLVNGMSPKAYRATVQRGKEAEFTARSNFTAKHRPATPVDHVSPPSVDRWFSGRQCVST